MERTTASGLIIPQNVAGVRTVEFKCLGCGREFYDDELRQYTQHVPKCVKGNEQEMRERSMREKAPEWVLPWDPEYADYLKTDRGRAEFIRLLDRPR